jgi:predicted DNA-binding transcriptional regulator YafY
MMILVEFEQQTVIDYTNYKGERRKRRILPLNLWWGSNVWHAEPQLFLLAQDLETGEERYFAIKDIHTLEQP